MLFGMNYRLNYKIYGTGKNIYLAFHGFGQRKTIFQPFYFVLPDSQIISFDLYFHGSELTTTQRSLSPDDWKHMILRFLKQHQIEKFGLIGFSMGGKIALQTVLLFPDRITDLILLAPDGVKIDPWYKLATQFTPTQRLFKKIMSQKMSCFNKFMHIFHQVGLVDQSIFKIYNAQTKTQLLRERIYKTWMLYALFLPNMKDVASILNENQIYTQIFVGKHDRMIPEQNMKKLTKYLTNYSLDVINSNHYNLVNATFRFMKTNQK